MEILGITLNAGDVVPKTTNAKNLVHNDFYVVTNFIVNM